MARQAVKRKLELLVRHVPKGFVGTVEDLHVDDRERLERVQASKVKAPVRNTDRKIRDGAPTPERLGKLLVGDLEIGEDGRGHRIYSISEAPIARMFKSGRLSGIQFTALNRFHSHWWNAGLSESVRGVDLNRIYAPDPFPSAGMSKTERQYQNRVEYRNAYKKLTHLEGILVTNLICSERYSLDDCGYFLGFTSRFRAREAATKVICSIADRFSKHWGIS